MRKVHFEQGSPEWLEWRRGRLTATDAAALLGVSRYVTPFKCWQRKTGQAPEQYVTDAMRRGHTDEPIAREIFVTEYGIPMKPACIESERHPHLGASLDGISECGEYILEIKSQQPVDEIPIDHMCQMQKQLLCTDGKAKQCFYVSHWMGVNKTFVVLPDPNWVEDYLPKASEFWKGVLLFDPPALSNRDYVDMSGASEWNSIAEQYRNLCEQIKALEEIKAAHKKCLIELCGDNSCMGFGIKVMKKSSKGRIDYEKACESLSINQQTLNEFRKPNSFTWTITLDQK